MKITDSSRAPNAMCSLRGVDAILLITILLWTHFRWGVVLWFTEMRSSWLISSWSGELCVRSCMLDMSSGQMTRESFSLDGCGEAGVWLLVDAVCVLFSAWISAVTTNLLVPVPPDFPWSLSLGGVLFGRVGPQGLWCMSGFCGLVFIIEAVLWWYGCPLRNKLPWQISKVNKRWIYCLLIHFDNKISNRLLSHQYLFLF